MMITRLLAGAACGLALGAAAHADEPFTLADSQLDTVTAAGVFAYDAAATVFIDIDMTKDVLVDSAIQSTVDATGLSALANAFADAVGSEDAIVETDTFAQTDAFALIAQAGSTSLSAMVVNGGGGINGPE